jgi:uncharacterized ion transporter superfamily protein YfcC
VRFASSLLLLLGAVIVAAALTWILPTGQFDRRDDPATGRRVVVAGTYHRVERSAVGPFAAAVAVARGLVAGADVIAVVLFVGGAWVVVDRVGALEAVLTSLVGGLGARGVTGLWTIPIVSLFFAAMGALENMQEEIIPLVPALLVLGRSIGVDAVGVVAMSAGAAMIGSAFGPTNPFQAGIALKLAQLPPLVAGRVRLGVLLASVALWTGWTTWHAARARLPGAAARAAPRRERPGMRRHTMVLLVALAPMAAYVFGVLRFDWGFNELSGAFLIGGGAAGLVAGLSLMETVAIYVEGMQSLVPAAVMIGVARSISLVLEDGRVVDTILNALASMLGQMPPAVAAFLMIPVQALLHVPVPSVSGQAVLTMPVMVPLADLLRLPRLVPVLTYETGGGLMELLTPTNGALMAILVAAGLPFQKWLRFAAGGALLAALCGMTAIALVAAGAALTLSR